MRLPRIHAGRRRALLWRLVANGLAQGALAIGLAQLLGSALDRSGSGSLWPEAWLHHAVWLDVAGLVGAGLLNLGLRAVEAADAERLGQDYVMRVRLRIFEAATRGSAAAARRGRWGVTMTRLISDLNSLRNWVSAGIARSVVAAIVVAGVCVGLVHTHPAALAAAGTMVGLSVGAVLALSPRLRLQIREARRRRGRLANNLGEKLLAGGAVRQFDRDRPEVRRIRTHSVWLRDALVRRMRLAQILRSAPAAALPVALGVLVVLGGRFDLSTADLAVGVLLLGILGSALSDLARAVDHRLAFEEGRRRIDDILGTPRIREARDAVDLEGGGPVSVHVGRVSVRGRLRAGPFEARPGQTVRVSGPPGSGKSTLLALVARWLDPRRGGIEIDGVALRRLSLASLGRTVQLVTPDVPLLRGRIIDNLTYGGDAIDDEWLAKVAAICGLRESDPLLPDGLETRTEEQGRNLPEGLRARVALARAAAVSPRLLLIDHPTLLVDPEARSAMLAVVGLLGCTAFIAAPEGPPLFPADREWSLAPPSHSSSSSG